ncbi:hypothetical protein ACTMTI_34855 [Nonomuraea sp. H19]|uniref:hypothetical protein n=1 Tax=Nonomuraea sp. H19 TaxID=3452206 RepID=UPI003F8C0551
MNFHYSLARGIDPAPPGTLHARTVTGAVEAPPSPGAAIRFGRGEPPAVDLSLGRDDLRVSRRHGEVSYDGRRWWLRNTGQQLLRLPRGRLMHITTEPVPLDAGYTPVFVRGSGHREHLVELYVAGHDDARTPRRADVTLPPKIWPLNDDERLLLVVLGQRYLLYEESPSPLSYRQAAEQLAYLRPHGRWRERRIENKIEAVRRRLHAGGFPYPVLHDKAAGGPSDNLLHNLLRGLVESTTLVPPHLELMEEDSGS